MSEILAEIESKGLLKGRCLEIYRLLVINGARTASEIFVDASAINKGSVSARLSDLQAFGCVQKIGHRICRVSKKRAAIFDVNGELPRRVLKPPSVDLKDWSVRARIVLRGFLERVADPSNLSGQDRWFFETAQELLREWEPK
jgi:hypothetical protein